MKKKIYKKILAIRPDRMGDAILTLPAINALKEQFPESEIYFLVREEIAPLFKNNPDIKGMITIKQGEKTQSIKEKIKTYNFDCSVHFFLTKETVFAAFFARIPLRIGPFSKPSAFFLTKRIVQNRKKSQKHEADYNLELTSALGASSRQRESVIYLTGEEKKKYSRLSAGKVVGIHPGGAQRGKRLPAEKFLSIAEDLGRKNKVIVSIGPDDMELKSVFNGFEIFEGLPLRDFAALISNLSLFITNSTGPLHLACALGVPTVSFFGRDRAVCPVRWGPYPPASKNLVFFVDDFNIDSALSHIREMVFKQ